MTLTGETMAMTPASRVLRDDLLCLFALAELGPHHQMSAFAGGDGHLVAVNVVWSPAVSYVDAQEAGATYQVISSLPLEDDIQSFLEGKPAIPEIFVAGQLHSEVVSPPDWDL